MWLNAGKWSLLEALLFGVVIVALLYAWARFEAGDRRPRLAERVLHALDRLADVAFAGAVLVIGLVIVAFVIGANMGGVAAGALAALVLVWLLVRARMRTARARRSGEGRRSTKRRSR
jgi:hypothetical protein